MGIYTEVLAAHCSLFEQEMPRFLPTTDGIKDTVINGMVYACTDGGKRIRPVLTMEFCRLTCGDEKIALPFAAAIEMIHSYSLVHDDMPCMDNSPLRRGKPAVHKAFGEDMALLTGDALLNRAFEVALADYGLEPKNVLAATKILADAAGIDGMVGGQCIDLESEGKNIDLQRLQLLQKGKTAALLSAACGMGVAIGGGSDTQLKAAMIFGENLGLAFQVIDDILDVTAEASVLGKPVGSDAENEKVTYVSLCGLDGAKKAAQSMTDTALQALSAFDGDTTHLQMLANALLERKQ